MSRVLILAMTLLITAAAAANAAQTVSSEITEATVFFDQARVARQASIRVDSGVHRLAIPTEAFLIDKNSVTAEIKGNGEILGVHTTEIPLLEPRQEKILDLENKKNKLLSDKRAIDDKITALDKQKAFLDSVVDFSETQMPSDIKTQMPSMEELGRTVDFLGKRYSEILNKKRSAETKANDLQKEIKIIDRELNMLQSRSDKTATAIEIMFRSPETQNLEITTRYLVKNAGWSPVYRAMADDAVSQIELSMMAEIVQKTGEDWKDATITVSTMVPVKGGRLPELSTWYIDTPVIRKFGSAADSSRQMEQLAGAPEKARRARPAEAEKKETAISFEYTMPEPITVESREEKTLLPVFTKFIDGDFHYYAVPKTDSRAYLVYEAKSDSELLAGPLNTFFAGRYTGKMFLEEKQAGQPFLLGLGADRTVSVRREKIKDHRKETAFFGKIERDAVVREIQYRITAENQKNRPIKLRISDHIPVSKTDRIKVEDVKLDPEPDKRDIDGNQGVMQWQSELKAGQTAEILISFTVAYPKDMPPPAF